MFYFHIEPDVFSFIVLVYDVQLTEGTHCVTNPLVNITRLTNPLF